MKHFNVKMVSWATSTFTRTYRAHHLFALSTLELTGNCMSSSRRLSPSWAGAGFSTLALLNRYHLGKSRKHHDTRLGRR